MKPAATELRDSSRNSPREMVILFSAGGVTFAISASAVEEIRELAGVERLAEEALFLKPPKVTHSFERQGRRYIAVDARVFFHMTSRQATRLMVLRHIRSGVMVDSIQGMQEIEFIHTLPEAFIGEERGWYRGLTVVDGKVVPVMRPDAFLSKAEAILLNSALETATKGMAVTA